MAVDSHQLWRWHQGIASGGGAMLAMMRLALQVPGGGAALMGEDVVVIFRPVVMQSHGGAATGEGREGVDEGRED